MHPEVYVCQWNSQLAVYLLKVYGAHFTYNPSYKGDDEKDEAANESPYENKCYKCRNGVWKGEFSNSGAGEEIHYGVSHKCQHSRDEYAGEDIAEIPCQKHYSGSYGANDNIF